MDIIKIRYSGRVSAGMQKKFTPDKPGRTKKAQNSYQEKVLEVHGLAGLKTLRSHLGLSSLPNLQKESESSHRARRGSKGISSSGRNIVRDAATYLEEKHGRKQLSFLTLTIPPEAMKPALFQEWQNLTRKLRQRLVYALEARGLDTSVIGVVEIQPRRQTSCGTLPALHWHFVFQGRKRWGTWELRPEFFRGIWESLISDALGFDVQCPEGTRVEPIHTSASGYLGKYMSKSGAILSSIDPQYLPTAWYMCTRPLLRIINKLIVYATGAKARQVYDFLMNNKGYLRFSKDVTLETDSGRQITVGWYGDLTNRDTYRNFLGIANKILERVPRRIS